MMRATAILGLALLAAPTPQEKPKDDAVVLALRWLARHQSDDGSWSVRNYRCGVVKGFDGKCTPNPGAQDYDVGVTGLALLAFLGAGHADASKETADGIAFGDVVKKGLQYLAGKQDKDGCVGGRAHKYTYNHLVAAAALIEAFALTQNEAWKTSAQKALDYSLAAQNPGKGWRYSAKCGDNDTSITGWGVLVLRLADVAGLKRPKEAWTGAKAWFDECTDPKTGLAGYTHKGTGKVFVPGMNENFDHHETMTAIALNARLMMDKKKDEKTAKMIAADPPKADKNAVDAYYWHHATLAIWHHDGPNGPLWKAWSAALKTALVDRQNADAKRCKYGSWEPDERWSGEGGRVYVTALNALTLEVASRYPLTVDKK